MEIFLYLLYLVLIVGGVFTLMQLWKIKQNESRLDWLSTQEYTIIRIDVPRNNEKAPLAAEQMFASIHGIYSDNSLFQNHLSFEIVAKDKFIQFYVFVPKHLKEFVEGQIYAQYPTVEINEVPDYTKEIGDKDFHFAGTELKPTKPDVYPIKLFSDFEVDPISGITSVMSKLNPGEQVWLQINIRPVGDEWQDRGNKLISAIRSGKKQGASGTFAKVSKATGTILKMFFAQAITPGAEVAAPAETKVELPGTVEDALKSIELKIMKLGYETKIRILSIAEDEITARVKTQGIAASFKQFNTTNLNGFKTDEILVDDRDFWQDFCSRVFEDEGNVFNIGELASLYHFPHKSVATPNIVWSGSKKGEPPANLPLSANTPPEDLTIIGETTFRNIHQKFGIKRDDRRRHTYIIGKSGVGKSVLMENMAIDDVLENRGVIIVDPHGEFAEKVISCVPDSRVDDVVVFDPADRAFPIAFNLLEHVEDDFKGMVASGFVGIFKKIFGNSWGPRLEHILRNTVLALLDYPNSTMLDIPKMLTEAKFRDRVVEAVKDPVIREFWTMEFAQYDAKFRTEAVSPILNKVGQFLSTATIRNIVGQPKSTLDIRQIMDEEKIMVVDLSRGKIGEDNSALLGAMLITKIQLAAMSRADITVDKRPDCYLYVDEFQNFATESFATILSEARKYHLNLNIANQYITQMPEEVRDAVFGNAGTIISFRVGGTDADYLVKEYEPVFEANDLVNLDKFNIYIKLLVDGVSAPAFSARTLPPRLQVTGNSEKIIDLSHKKYSATRADVEYAIENRNLKEQQEALKEAEAFKQGGLEALLTMKKDSEKKPYSAPGMAEYKPSAPKPEVKVETQIDTEPKMPQASITAPVKNIMADDESKEKEEKVRVFRYQNVIGDKLYKEQTARGGVKWYTGEDIDEAKMAETGIVVDEAGKKMIEINKKIADKFEKGQKQGSHHEENGGSGTSISSGHSNNAQEEKKIEIVHNSEKNDKAGESEPKKSDTEEALNNANPPVASQSDIIQAPETLPEVAPKDEPVIVDEQKISKSNDLDTMEEGQAIQL